MSTINTTGGDNGSCPSYTLQDHYEELTAIKAIREGKWQYVVVQNVGALAGADPATFERYQTAFDREIRGIRDSTDNF